MKLFFRHVADYIRECDKVLYGLVIFTTCFGCLAVLSATYFFLGSIRQFVMHLVSMLLGIVAVIVISIFNYKKFCRFWPFFALVGLSLVVLTFFIGYAPSGTDDKAWLTLPGNISFQPSELLKVCFIISFSYHIARVGERVKEFRHILLLCIHGAIPVLLIHLQGDDGTALVFAIMFICMLFVAGVKARYFVIFGSVVAVTIPILYFFIMNDDQKARIYALLFPTEEDYLGILWQQWRGRVAMANGGLTGQGIFKGSLVQSGSIPYGYNDFIFTSIGEEFGMLGCFAVLILLMAICIRIMRNGRRSTDTLGLMICTGVFSMIVAQMTINIGMCLSILPVIGVTLPFFSAGGTSLLCTYLSIGLVMSVYMHKESGTYLHDI